MYKDVHHNPIDAADRAPYGALRAGERLSLSFGIFRYYDVRKAFIVINKDGEDKVYYPMRWTELSDGYDRFSGGLEITSTGLYFYHFEVLTPSGIFNIGPDNEMSAQWQSNYDWAVTVYEPQYKTPEWMKNGIIYQIFPDRFNIGGNIIHKNNEAVYHDNWFDVPAYLPDEHGEILNNDFFGGNIKGITEKLGYLKSLNVACIYLNPIFEAYSNHKYDTGNYEVIDSAFGTEEDFEELITEAGKLGIKIILDGVFNHTGSDSKYFNKKGRYKNLGAYQSKISQYYKWYNFQDFPDKYDSWWGISTLPAVNENELSYDNYINGKNGIIERWMKKGIGGFRLDVVDELPDFFLDNLVKAAKSIKEDAVIIGEVWENAATKTAYGVRRRYFQGRQLDSVMNYPFQKAVIEFILRGSAESMSAAINSVASSYPKEITDILMNLLSTHDTERIMTHLYGEESYKLTRMEKAYTSIPEEKMDMAVRKVKLAATLLYTLPGIPCIYYADEAGQEGYGDPFCRRTYPWGSEKKELVDYYISLGKIRNEEVFREGYINIVYTDTGVIIFKRFIGSRFVYVAANSDNKPYKLKIDGVLNDMLTGEKFNGEIILDPVSARILF